MRRFAHFVPFALALLLCLLTGAGGVRAEVQQLRVTPLEPIGRSTITFTVTGVQPSPCFTRVMMEDLTGVEDDSITLWFALQSSDTGGEHCPQVPISFSFDFVFEQGVPAGDYVVRVGERTIAPGGGFTDRVLQFAVKVLPNSTSIVEDARSWGALKVDFEADAHPD